MIAYSKINKEVINEIKDSLFNNSNVFLKCFAVN